MSLSPLPSLRAGGWLDFVGMELSAGLGLRLQCLNARTVFGVVQLAGSGGKLIGNCSGFYTHVN